MHAHGHCVDTKVAAALVVFERAGLHGGLARFAPVALGSGLYKFNLPPVPGELGGAKILVDRDFARFECGGCDFGHGQRIPNDDKVYVLRVLAVHQTVAHPATHDVARQTEFVGCGTYRLKQRMVNP